MVQMQDNRKQLAVKCFYANTCDTGTLKGKFEIIILTLKAMIKTIRERVVFENKFATIYNNDVRFESGNEGTHIKLDRASKGGAQVLAITKNGDLVLIKNFRYAAGRSFIEIPAGGVELHETSIDGAVRELAEETGYKARRLTHIGTMHREASYDGSGSTLYIGWDCEPIDGIEKDINECIEEVQLLPFKLWPSLLTRIEDVDPVCLAAVGMLIEVIGRHMFDECAEDVSSSYIMGAYCAGSGLAISANPFRNTEAETSEYIEWDKGWYGFHDHKLKVAH
ncbi:hypothetical protein VCHA53O466_50148 [Vibrio chagasii]|nr:hypothetical protein VCHA53O466_50148 [Vibrio chagasii]